MVATVNGAGGPGAVRAGLSLFAGCFAVGLIDLLLLSRGPAASAEGIEQLSRFVPLTLIAVPAIAGLGGLLLSAVRAFLLGRTRPAAAEVVTDLLAASPLLACIPGLLAGPAISGSPWRWPLGLAAALFVVATAALLRRGARRGAELSAAGGPRGRALAAAVPVLLFGGIAGAQAVTTSVLAGLYPDFHRAVALCAVGLASACLFALAGRTPRLPGTGRTAVAFAVALALGAPAGAWLTRGAVLGRQLIADHGPFSGPFAGTLHAASRALAFDPPWTASGGVAAEVVARAGIAGAAFGEGAPRRDVLLITVDALRGDAVDRASPLARGALFFERAYSPSNYTPFSMPALVLGYASAPGSEPPASRTLAEAFRRGGYETELHFTAHEYASLERTALWPLASRGFLFDRYRPDYLDAATVLARVERALAAGAGPRFVWAHLSDVHAPFLLGRAAGATGAACPATYAGQLECLLGVLEPWLERLRARDPGLVWALSSDHGESLGERGVRFHGSNLFDEQVRVPLLLGGPGVGPGVHPGPVGNARLGATLLSLAGARLPEGAVRLPRSPSEPPGPAVLLVGRGERCGVVEDGFKLIAAPREGAVALYDLRADPGETTNLVARDPARARRMLSALPGLGCPFDLAGLLGSF